MICVCVCTFTKALPSSKDTPFSGKGTAEAIGQRGDGLRSPFLDAPETNQPEQTEKPHKDTAVRIQTARRKLDYSKTAINSPSVYLLQALNSTSVGEGAYGTDLLCLSPKTLAQQRCEILSHCLFKPV